MLCLFVSYWLWRLQTAAAVSRQSKEADPEASAASNVILYSALPSASLLRGGLLLELAALQGRMSLARRLIRREPKIRDLRTCAILGNQR
jgi:hypothetical protein